MRRALVGALLFLLPTLMQGKASKPFEPQGLWISIEGKKDIRFSADGSLHQGALQGTWESSGKVRFSDPQGKNTDYRAEVKATSFGLQLSMKGSDKWDRPVYYFAKEAPPDLELQKVLLGRWVQINDGDDKSGVVFHEDGTGTLWNKPFRWRLSEKRLLLEYKKDRTQMNNVIIKGKVLNLCGFMSDECGRYRWAGR